MTGFFITGTDTDVGKTYITARLAREYIAQGKRIAIRKPVASGCGERLDACADARLLAQVSGEDEWLVCPHRFAPAVSPARAMQEAGLQLSINDLLSACHYQTDDKMVLVEGAGGWLSPLTPTTYNADLAAALQLPVILVVANQLGCINHTLLTLHHLYATGLRCDRIILNTPKPDNAIFLHELTDHLQRYLPEIPLEQVGFLA